MATIATVSAFLALYGPEFIKGLFKGAGAKTGELIISKAIEIFKENHKDIDVAEAVFGKLKIYMRDDPGWFNKLVAQVKLRSWCNAILIGPSGAGKTSLRNYLDEPLAPPPAQSTSERKSDNLLSWSQYVHVTDTPGSFHQVDGKEHIQKPFREGNTILIIVLGAGFLKTVGVDSLRRPGMRRDELYSSVQEYHQKCLDEEAGYLATILDDNNDVAKQFSYIMVAINKLDLWKECYDNVISYYKGELTDEFTLPGKGNISFSTERSKKIAIRLAAVAEKYGKQGIKPTFHPCAMGIDPFKDVPSTISQQEATLSRQLFRAQFRARIIED